MTLLSTAHYFVLVFAIQLVAGLLLLSNRFVPLALTLLAPVLVNILMHHSLMDPTGLPPGIFAAILWAIVFTRARGAFADILSPTCA